jgi:nucleoside-diphosphate-sugar epimerase
MKILFIGGTGFISTAVTRLALAQGHEVYHLNRGMRPTELQGVKQITADVHKYDEARKALKGQSFDVVVDWIAYKPEDIERDLELFRGKTRQFFFISSASAYQKPPAHYIITESTPLYNPHWDYSRNKIACEDRLNQAYRDEDFPMVIVRPSLTYDPNLPIAIGGWGCYTLPDRLKKGKPIIVHGDGSSLWTVTHADDFGRGFLGLFGNEQTIGHAFHITSDEVLTWNEIYQTIADAMGVKPKMVHIASERIAEIAPQYYGSLIGDKSWSAVFDNSKIKSFVPTYQAVILFREGIKRTLAWFDADEKRRRIDDKVNQEMDMILEANSVKPVQRERVGKRERKPSR